MLPFTKVKHINFPKLQLLLHKHIIQENRIT